MIIEFYNAPSNWELKAADSSLDADAVPVVYNLLRKTCPICRFSLLYGPKTNPISKEEPVVPMKVDDRQRTKRRCCRSTKTF